MPPIERWPIGGYFSFCTTSRASAAVSTCGTTMPSAPLSSTRVAMEYSPFGTRTIGAMPASSAATAICAAASIDIVPCSRSRNSQSKPAVFMAMAISTLRVMRTPVPSDSSPCSSFSRATLRIVGMTCPFAGLLPARGDGSGDHAVERCKVHRVAGLVVDGDNQSLTAEDEDALIGCARRPRGIRRQIGETAIGVAAEARSVAAARMRGSQCIVGPARRQQTIAAPDAVLHIKHAKFGVVPQSGEAGAGRDEIADAISGVLVGAHAQTVG